MKIELMGRGGEIVVGSLSKKQFTFWSSLESENEDMFDAVLLGDEEINEKLKPEQRLKHWTELDDLAHVVGPELEDSSLRVLADDGSVLWEGNLSEIIENELEDFAEETEDFYFSASGKKYGFFAYHRQKGLFETFFMKSVKDWDIAKLRVRYSDIEGISLITSLSYDGKDLKALGDISTDSINFEKQLIENEDNDYEDDTDDGEEDSELIDPYLAQLLEVRQLAQQWYANGELAKAAQFIQSKLKLIKDYRPINHPDRVSMIQFFSVILTDKSEYEEANSVLESLLKDLKISSNETDEAYKQTCGYLALNLIRWKKFKEAIPYFEVALGQITDSYFHYQYGRALRNLNQNEEAFLALSRALALNEETQQLETRMYIVANLYNIENINFEEVGRNWDDARAVQFRLIAMDYPRLLDKLGRSTDAKDIRDKLRASNLLETLPSNQEFLELCKKGKLAGICAAFDCGFDVESSFSHEEDVLNTPICHAANGEIARVLIDNDGKMDSWNDVPLTHSVLALVAEGNLDLSTLEVLAEDDPHINSDWDGTNGDFLIHAAVRTGRKDILDVVLAAGGDPKLLSNDGDSAIGIAASMGNTDLVKTLIDAGSPLSADEFEFGIEFEDEEDRPEVSEPIELAKTKKIAALIRGAQ